ncbi:DUF488 domain-containing protein [Paenibacillus medicaginis]|uniref:DUF488 domain-containing protein n=1 Tax=Paenibacillus medicaginis TaxID=1470560 RepID=A0ABV5BU65_9BACL
MFVIKRIYDRSDPDDQIRVLVDRLWPRGIDKRRAQLTTWMKEVAPSGELRRWFGHDPDKFTEFSSRYMEELQGASAQPYLRQLREWAENHTVTLLYAAKDEQCNHALILKQVLQDTKPEL